MAVPERTDAAAIHASCVLLGGAGILLRGGSGSGKSTSALLLIEHAGLRGEEAALVADDRVLLSVEDGLLRARPHPVLAGLIELRGIGIVRLPHAPEAVIRLVVDLVPEAEVPRLPEPDQFRTPLLGLEVARIAAAAGLLLPIRIRHALAAADKGIPTSG